MTHSGLTKAQADILGVYDYAQFVRELCFPVDGVKWIVDSRIPHPARDKKKIDGRPAQALVRRGLLEVRAASQFNGTVYERTHKGLTALVEYQRDKTPTRATKGK